MIAPTGSVPSRPGDDAREDLPAAPTLAAFLDAAAWSGYQIRSCILIALTILFEGMDQNLLAVTIPALSRVWDVEAGHFATITAIATIAMLLGSAVAGVLSDRLGRRWTLIGATLLYGAGGLLAAAAWNVPSMGAARLITGLGLGAALTTAVISLAEHTPARKRGVVIAFSMLGVPVGGILAGLLGAGVIARYGWAAVYLAGAAAPLVLATLYLLLLPETPAYLRLRTDDGLARYFARMRLALPAEFEAGVVPIAPPRGSPFALLAPEYRRNTLLLWAGFFSSLLISYHVMNWLPALMARAGASTALASASISYVSAGALCGGIAASFLVFFLGSRLSMVGGAAASLLVGLWLVFAFDAHPAGAGTLAILPLVLIGVAVMNTLFYTILPNVYPVAVRGVGIGGGMAVGRLGAVASAYSGSWGLGGGGTRFFAVVVVAAAVALLSFALVDKHQPRGR